MLLGQTPAVLNLFFKPCYFCFPEVEEENEEEEAEEEEDEEDEEESNIHSYNDQLTTFLEDLLSQQKEQNQQGLQLAPHREEEEEEDDEETWTSELTRYCQIDVCVHACRMESGFGMWANFCNFLDNSELFVGVYIYIYFVLLCIYSAQKLCTRSCSNKWSECNTVTDLTCVPVHVIKTWVNNARTLHIYNLYFVLWTEMTIQMQNHFNTSVTTKSLNS